ncbi:hypothetical protein E2542_SST18225 [Spatholobus suberectus]|nr:hypothetical protein E2542_SST18225 [Spatholobus suberectus]
MLAKALAKYFGAKLLIFDSHWLLDGLSYKEAELLKNGFNAEKSCSCAKQSPTATDMARSIDPSASEPDTPSSSNAPTSCGFESQPKLEADNISSSRSPANGSQGKVVFLFDDNPLSKIGVRFDKPKFQKVHMSNSRTSIWIDETLAWLALSSLETKAFPFMLTVHSEGRAEQQRKENVVWVWFNK